MAKFIFVTGGVVSSLGKGLTAASIGNLLENRGLKLTLLKFDPYLNVDPGTMRPRGRSMRQSSPRNAKGSFWGRPSRLFPTSRMKSREG